MWHSVCTARFYRSLDYSVLDLCFDLTMSRIGFASMGEQSCATATTTTPPPPPANWSSVNWKQIINWISTREKKPRRRRIPFEFRSFYLKWTECDWIESKAGKKYFRQKNTNLSDCEYRSSECIECGRFNWTKCVCRRHMEQTYIECGEFSVFARVNYLWEIEKNN